MEATSYKMEVEAIQVLELEQLIPQIHEKSLCGHNVKEVQYTKLKYLNDNCPFCLNPLLEKKKAICMYDCEHIFHKDCIEKYILFSTKSNCSLCRSETLNIKKYETIKEYVNLESVICDDDNCSILQQNIKRIRLDEYIWEINFTPNMQNMHLL